MKPLDRWMIALFRPHRLRLLGALLLGGVISGARAGLALLVEELVTLERSPVELAIAVATLQLIYSGALLGRGLLSKRVGLKVIAGLRSQLFQALGAHQPPELAGLGAGHLHTLLAEDLPRVQLALGALMTVVQRPLTVLALSAVIVSRDPLLGSVALVALPIALSPLVLLDRSRRHAVRLESKSHEALSSRLVELVHRAAVLRLADRGDDMRRQLEASSHQQLSARWARYRVELAAGPLAELAAGLGAAALILVAGLRLRSGAIDPARLTAVLVALGLLHQPLRALAGLPAMWGNARHSLGRVRPLLDRARTPPTDTNRLLPEGALSASLRGFSPRLQRSLDLDLQPGEALALCGPSGSGKSTLIATLLGWLPFEGQRCLGGQPVGSLSLPELRDRVALLPQEAGLIGGTVAENLRLVRPGADDRLLHSVLRDVELPDLPLDRALEEGGVGVSRGQRQRLGLARVLLSDAGLVLLDEPTQGLPSDQRERLTELLRAALQGRSVLWVTHDTAIAQRCDRILWLAAGDGGVGALDSLEP